jgi:hypothetical protein
MKMIELLKEKAVERGLMGAEEAVDAEKAFRLVRDMPYLRASDRKPETIIKEWRGTCSGKHYLLQKLFGELGIKSRVMACTVEFKVAPEEVEDSELEAIVREAEGRFVDVHNYLILDLSEGEMIVDATWPLATQEIGFPVNEGFVLGQDQKIADTPIKQWVVPEDGDPQDFKDQLLKENFTETELRQRDAFIMIVGKELMGLYGGG